MKRLFISIFIYYLTISLNAQEQDNTYIKQKYDSDSLFVKYAQKGFIAVIDDINDYYEDILPKLPIELQRTENFKMRQIAADYKSLSLEREADFMEALILPESTEELMNTKIFKMQKIATLASEEGNVIINLRSLEAIFDIYWRSMKFAKALRQGYIIDNELKKVSDNDYPGKGNAYYRIGKAFFFFKDYNKALPYLRKALKPAKYYFDRSNLQARNMIGDYYNMTGNIDSAEFYFRSAFFTTQKIKSKPLFDAIALSNIGQSLLIQEDYDNAISYLDVGMKKMLEDDQFEYSAKAAMGLAKCFLAKNKLNRAKNLIDSAQLLIQKSKNIDLYQSLYPLKCKYYAKTKNANLLSVYSDSAILINKLQADKYNGLYLLKAEQELFESERFAKAQELKLKEENYQSKQIYATIAIILVSIVLIVYIVLYRKNRKAYRALVQKNQEWAQITPIYVEEQITDDNKEDKEEKKIEAPSEEDRLLMKRVYDIVTKEKIFKDLDLTLDSLAKKMDVNRNYLSKAINKTTGKNFKTYINEYRVKEAIKILSSEKSDIISIDAIAIEVGFNNRTSFYQSFRKITGLSPSDFRNNRVN